MRDQPCPAVFLEDIIIPHGLARGLLGCWMQEPATLLHGSRRMKVLAMCFFFSLFDPCILSLSGTRQPPRWTQNVNQLLEWWGTVQMPCFDRRTVRRLRPALHVHVAYPSPKEGGELTQACALSLSFLHLLFLKSQDDPVMYPVSILFVLVHMFGCYGAEPNHIFHVR